MAELSIKRVGDVVTLTFERPERMNALTASLRGEMAAVLADVAVDRTVGAVVLTWWLGAYALVFGVKEVKSVRSSPETLVSP